MNSNGYIKERFEALQSKNGNSEINTLRQSAFKDFTNWGIPGSRHEEWKYTRIDKLFNRDWSLNGVHAITEAEILKSAGLPGHEHVNSLVFLEGRFLPSHSHILSEQLVVLKLEEAAGNEFRDIVSRHLGHSGKYARDGINALNTSLIQEGVFVHVKSGKVCDRPLYIYHISDSRENNSFCQPRALIHLGMRGQLQLVETFCSLGVHESLTNQVTEIVVEEGSRLEYYKIQADGNRASQVSTTHIRQTGRSYTHSVVVSLCGAVVRNNLNVIFDAEYCESHLYGLYCLNGQTHTDNHTIVDNRQPNCLSNELYKGILDEEATGVFNGKIFVRKDAQKTNAYQSNKNILISDKATVNTKPQLEIFADDVRCSHGCTVGSLDEEALFYLRSRGLSQENARAFLLGAFSMDILNKINLEPIRDHVNRLIARRLEFETI